MSKKVKFTPPSGKSYFANKSFAEKQARALLWEKVGPRQYVEMARVTRETMKGGYIPENLPPLDVPGVKYVAPKLAAWSGLSALCQEA